MMHDNLWHVMSSFPYPVMEVLFIACIDAILNDILIFDVIKSKAMKFVGHSKNY